MNEAPEQAVPAEQASAQEAGEAWQTPDYQVVDTALEVTAYALSSDRKSPE